MPTALVTGSAGFIGYFVCQRLLDEGWDVTGFDAITDYYDVTLKLTRNEAQELVARVEQAFQSSQTLRQDPAARVYLVALLLWRQWNR